MKKILKIIGTVIAGAFILISLLDIEDLWIVIVLCALAIFLIWKKPRKKKENNKPTKIEQVNNEPQKKTTYSFHIAGTTFEQQDGKTGQEILAKVPLQIIRDRDEKLYGGYTLKEMEEDYMTEVNIYFGQEFDADIEEYMYEDEIAVKVFLLDDEENKYQIGNIKRNDIDLFKNVYAECKYMNLQISGGKVKDIFGEIEERNYSAFLYVYI